MPNYIPKEKKPVLNREAIQKDLRNLYATPAAWRYCVGFAAIGVLPITISLIVNFFLPGGQDKGGLIFSIIGLMTCTMILLCVWIAAYRTFSIPIKIRKNKFYIIEDTVDRKLAREPVWNHLNHRDHDGDVYRYPCVIYFKKCGRHELLFDTRGDYGEYSSRVETAAERQLDKYKLDKVYYVVTFNLNKPNVVLVYDPDEYDVQL